MVFCQQQQNQGDHSLYRQCKRKPTVVCKQVWPGPQASDLAIHHSEAMLRGMNDWLEDQHG